MVDIFFGTKEKEGLEGRTGGLGGSFDIVMRVL